MTPRFVAAIPWLLASEWLREIGFKILGKTNVNQPIEQRY